MRLGSNKGAKFPGERFTPGEARAIVDAAGGDSALAARNRALVAVLYRAGLRAAEACALVPSDVDWRSGEVHVRNGKGARSRRVALDPDAMMILRHWRERRKARGFNGRAPLFCSLQGRRLDTSYLRRLIKRLAQQAGIDKRAHVHALRHTFACELLDEGQPLTVIQTLLGHGDLATTSRYLAHINPKEALDALRARGGWNA